MAVQRHMNTKSRGYIYKTFLPSWSLSLVATYLILSYIPLQLTFILDIWRLYCFCILRCNNLFLSVHNEDLV